MVFTKTPLISKVKVGAQYGRVTALSLPVQRPIGTKGRTVNVVLVRCECGVEKEVYVSRMMTDPDANCGCIARAAAGMAHRTHGRSQERLHHIWSGMKRRCENANNSNYKNYGGRGINICSEWQDYEVFRTWALANGYADDLTIDRKDNNKGYSPDNCRWATKITQARNRRPVVLVTAFGETKCITEWITDPRCKVGSHAGLQQRLERGMEPETAITTPLFDGVTAFGETKNRSEWVRDPRAGIKSAEGLRLRLLAGMDPETAITMPSLDNTERRHGRRAKAALDVECRA